MYVLLIYLVILTLVVYLWLCTSAFGFLYLCTKVEDFWALWNDVKGPHELPSGCNYYYFKEGIEPKWEDAANSHGGRWLMFLKATLADDELNDLWMRVVRLTGRFILCLPQDSRLDRKHH